MLRHDPYPAGYREGVANRFQFALPEPRPRDGWFRVGNLDITTTAMLVLAGVASMFVYAISKETFSKLIFDPVAVRNGEIWRLFTWPIANPPSHIWLVLTMLFFWIIGHAVEGMVGRVRFTVLIVVITVVPAMIVTLLPPAHFPTLDEMGLGMLATALFVVFAAEHPNMPFFFGVPAWIVATVFVGIDVLLWVGDRVWGTLILIGVRHADGADHGAAVGLRPAAHLHPQVRRFDHQSTHGGRRSSAGVPSAGRPTERGSVVEGPWSAPVPPRTTADAAAAQVELDELLDKISASGLNSLSTDEKRRLNELSKRLR